MRVYANYDYEEEYDQEVTDLEEWRLENLLRQGKVNCLYRTTTTKSKNIKSGNELLEAQIYPAFKSLDDVPRKKKKETREAQRKLNSKNSRRRLLRLININFGEGDYWCTFGWNDECMPATLEDAQKDIRNFINRIKYKQKKITDEQIKYIYVLAFDGYERPHFHLVISTALDRNTLEDTWGKCDRPNTRRIKPDDDVLLTGLATYVSQNPKGTKRYCTSKNLKKAPEPTRSYSKFKKRRVNRMARDYETLRAEMEKAYPGYKFIDAQAYHNGINDLFYIYARMTRY